MSLKHRLVCGAAVGAVLAAAGPAAAQTRPLDDQLNTQQQEIRQLQQQLQGLQTQVNDSKAQAQQAQEAAKAAQEKATAASATAGVGGPRIIFTKNNRPGWVSADGQNSIELTSRLHFDVGGFLNYSPASASTSPHSVNGGVNARRARIGVLGKFMGDWNYALVYDFGGTSDSLPTSGLENAFISYTGFKPAAIDLGYMDTPYTLDEATSSNDIMFLERASAQAIATSIAAGDARSAFGVRTHNDRFWAGVYLTGPTAGATHTSGEPIGAFGRFTYQVLQAPNYSLHLGVDAQGLIRPAAGKTLTLSDRPEIRIDPGFTILSTGTLGTAANPIDSASVYSLEAAAGYQSLYFQGEFFHFNVDRKGLSTASFNGGYAQASWTLTGEHRKYNPGSGAYSGITPAHPLSSSGHGYGAWEIAARYSEIDLNDNFTSGEVAGPGTSAVAGGKQTVYTLGLNWYPVNNIRFMLDYMHGKIDKASASTSTAPLGTPLGASFDAVALRTQIAF